MVVLGQNCPCDYRCFFITVFTSNITNLYSAFAYDTLSGFISQQKTSRLMLPLLEPPPKRNSYSDSSAYAIDAFHLPSGFGPICSTPVHVFFENSYNIMSSRAIYGNSAFFM